MIRRRHLHGLGWRDCEDQGREHRWKVLRVHPDRVVLKCRLCPLMIRQPR